MERMALSTSEPAARDFDSTFLMPTLFASSRSRGYTFSVYMRTQTSGAILLISRAALESVHDRHRQI